MTDSAAGATFAPATGWRRRFITLSVMVATIMQALDMTIANVALPNMQGALSTTQDQIAWVLTSYIVTSAIMMPPTGFLARRFGRKRLLVVAVSGFTITSMLCGIADSLQEIVFYRILQGGFGAFLVPLSQALMLDNYPRRQHGQAMAIWGIGVMIGPILGPTLGGYLTEYYSWRWVFFVNLPFGILALVGILLFVTETTRDRERRFDWFGFTLLGLAVGGFQLMLDRGELKDWFESIEIITVAVVAGMAFYMFMAHSLTTSRKPFLDPHIFADRNFVAGVIQIFVFGALLLPALALLPTFLQTIMGYPVITVGHVLAPRGAGAMIGMFLVGRLSHRVDARVILIVSLLLIAGSAWEMTSFNAEVDMWTLLWTGVVQGIGLGSYYVALNVVTFTTLPEHFRTEAAGVFNLARNVGASVSVSIVVALVTHYTQINHAEIVSGITPYTLMTQVPYLPEAWSLDSAAGRAALNAEVTRQAATMAYLNDFKLMTIVALAAIPLVFLFRLPRGKHA
jgi:MFS transporter, DHA2 family, multidrug resistance protein